MAQAATIPAVPVRDGNNAMLTVFSLWWRELVRFYRQRSQMLSDLYGVPFERDRARAIIVGLVGGTMPTGFATVTTSTLFYVVPSGALMGLVVSSITAIACTRSIGQIFIEHFESGATLHDLSIEES
jgi:hypothetical protein